MDTAVQKISWAEMPEKGNRGPVTQPEYAAVRDLELGEAIKFPCRWRHSGRGASKCAGVLNTYVIARQRDMKLQSTCQDGVVYVGRIE